jgi:ferredoxin
MKVKFLPQNIELEIQPNQTVKSLADDNGVFVKSICNGLPSCAECRVRVVEGEHNVLPPNTKEINLIGNGYFIDQRRLSCQLLCFGDITVDLSEQVEKQKNLGAKRPQGSRKTETEVSHAVTGNLIEQDLGLKEIATASEKTSGDETRGHESSQERARGQNQNQNQNQGERRPQGQQQNRNPNQRQGQNQRSGRGGQHQSQRGGPANGPRRDNRDRKPQK